MTNTPQNPKYIEEKLKEFDEKFKWLEDFDTCIGYDGKCLCQHCKVKSYFESSLSQALEHGYTQGKKDTEEEIVREIEKDIDSNDDGMWSGREYADSLKDKLLAKKEIK